MSDLQNTTVVIQNKKTTTLLVSFNSAAADAVVCLFFIFIQIITFPLKASLLDQIPIYLKAINSSKYK